MDGGKSMGPLSERAPKRLRLKSKRRTRSRSAWEMHGCRCVWPRGSPAAPGWWLDGKSFLWGKDFCLQARFLSHAGRRWLSLSKEEARGRLSCEPARRSTLGPRVHLSASRRVRCAIMRFAQALDPQPAFKAPQIMERYGGARHARHLRDSRGHGCRGTFSSTPSPRRDVGCRPTTARQTGWARRRMSCRRVSPASARLTCWQSLWSRRWRPRQRQLCRSPPARALPRRRVGRRARPRRCAGWVPRRDDASRGRATVSA